VNRLTNQLISYLLLLCISVTIVPLNLLHHHKEEAHCDKSNNELENNLCHISSYHAHELDKAHCEHKTHFNKKHEHCEFCKIITVNRNKYVANSHYSFIPNQLSSTNIVIAYSFFPNAVSSVIFSRGPPVV